ncbi:isoaspartyl peptidase/L-asparaginase isoform X1 [Leptinotarsa decemlineata]|uniref:isoaspartyl peptidase/L-asparaginase isoform X1 n=1 Tax=Leptinotarsa decemlineata TaxID=7539 RepID=UPI003D30B8E2
MSSSEDGMSTKKAKKMVDKKSTIKSGHIADKQFVMRNSVLTDLFDNDPHIRTVHHIFVAISICFGLHTMAHDYFMKNELHSGFTLIFSGFAKFHMVLRSWVELMLINCLGYAFFVIWAKTRTYYFNREFQKLWDIIWLLTYIGYLIISYKRAEFFVNTFQLPPPSACIILLEQARLSMKLHSFIRTTAVTVYNYKSYTEKNLLLPTFTQYLYFLFAPTCIFRTDYPSHSRCMRSFASSAFKMNPIILVHGGAGDIPDEWKAGKISGVKKSVEKGYKILKDGGSALDAVEAAVRVMEDLEEFNAGYGSVLNTDGGVEMDASIMVGDTLSAGAVTVVKDIAHPISLARMVMEKTPHILLAGEGANRFAKEQGVPTVPVGSLVTKKARLALDSFKRLGGVKTEIGHSHDNPGDVGTVGAVALDSKGNLAAATSTGGLNGKMVGRCSDTSMIGSGTYADNNIGAVSTTGHGESIAKFCLAHSILKEMEYGKGVQISTEQSLKKMTERLKNTAGAITLSKIGETGIYFTSNRMAWAYQQGNKIHFGIEQNQHETVDA